jgi:hypothetical protein
MITIKITDSTKFDKPSLEVEHPIVKENGEGVQKFWRYKNGYGASVVRFNISSMLPSFTNGKLEKVGSYGVNEGLWELAVIKFIKNGYTLCYDTEITSDVIGYLTEKKVEEYLRKIKMLKEVTGK